MDDSVSIRVLTVLFERHPLLSSARLGISVKDGVAVLSGYTSDGTVKALAELVAIEVPGLRAVVNEIETTPDQTWRYVDTRIAKRACDLLEWNRLTPHGFKLRVEHGRMSIYGTVPSQQCLEAISSVLREHGGARSVDNHLRIGVSEEPPLTSRVDITVV